MTRHRNPKRNAGFAFIEVLLAITILAFISATLWGAFSRTNEAKKKIEAAQERLHTARVALMRMTRELEMAYLTGHENTLMQERRTMFIATSSDIDELKFSWFGKQRMRADGAESDTGLVWYYSSPDPELPGVINLMRKETRRLQRTDPTLLAGDTYVLCPNISRLKYSFFDARVKEWRDQWSTLGGDGLDYLPTHVRITLTVFDERDQEVTFVSAARIQMTEKVQYMPQVGN